MFPLAHLFPAKLDFLIFLEHAKLISVSVTGLAIPSSWNVLSLIFISPLFLVIQAGLNSNAIFSERHLLVILLNIVLIPSLYHIILFFPYSTYQYLHLNHLSVCLLLDAPECKLHGDKGLVWFGHHCNFVAKNHAWHTAEVEHSLNEGMNEWKKKTAGIRFRYRTQ